MKRAGKLYNFDVARSDEQLEQMRDLEKRHVCVFCQEHFRNEHREPIEIETTHWLITKNDYPYDNTGLHLLLVPKEHVSTFAELSEAVRYDFTDAIIQAEQKWQLTSYALGMRSGDMRYNGGSVEHLHAHIVVGDASNPDGEPVRFKMSSQPK